MENTKNETVGAVLKYTFSHPIEMLIMRWNWKSAFFAGILRSSIYLLTHIKGGWQAALGAMSVEFGFRIFQGGISGSFVQALRNARPAWLATFCVLVMLPVYSHAIEYSLHTLNGDENRLQSLGISVSFSIISAFFNLFAMRRGLMITGETKENKSLWTDIKKFPRVIVAFVGFLPTRLWRLIQN